ncbi:hypothetical protein [Paenibacillus sp. KN14-4R]|uniref:hypothetical protein n=1 Tax=Paenibacillus sp. KN14-4R TaxID=3445773 RepID=UPI003F9F54EA
MKNKMKVIMLSMCLLAGGCAMNKKDAQPNIKPNSNPNPLHIQNVNQAGNAEEYANYVQLMTMKVWPHMSVIWPNINFSRLHMLFTDGKRAWDISASGIQEVPLEEVLKSFEMPSNSPGIPGGYSTGIWHQQSSVLVYMNQDEIMNHLKTYMTNDRFGMSYGTPFAFPLGTHELFHYAIQMPKWNSKISVISKKQSLVYPIEIGPRTYRLALIDNLYQAFLDKQNRKKHLGHAAYIYQMWKWEFPEDMEHVRRSDVMEGTARYVDTMADAYGKLGMKASQSQVHAYLARRFNETKREDVGTITQESYEISKLAGLLADEAGLRWKKQAEQGVTPLEVLLSQVTPLKLEKWADIMDNYHKQADEHETKLNQSVNGFLHNYDNKTMPLLIIPGNAGNMKLRTDGQYHNDAVPIEILPNSNGILNEVHLQVIQKTIGVQYLEGKKINYVIPIKDTEIQISNNHAILNTTELKGEFDVQMSEDQGGRKIYQVSDFHR